MCSYASFLLLITTPPALQFITYSECTGCFTRKFKKQPGVVINPYLAESRHKLEGQRSQVELSLRTVSAPTGKERDLAREEVEYAYSLLT